MLTSLDIRETQIQATAKYHITLVRMAIAKHSTINDRGDVDRREPSCSILCDHIGTSNRDPSMDVHLNSNTEAP